ncbi:hypothetical protein Val02_44000 [Virgisporangium aliadipatigenens]|uniref:N-acetyltransferase domain-containing protein n=1 Tax=Virgisporangium aliadipatigenens TaxID=741659 RepID=A0A8J4DRC6_9ACTN|nr:GNAT family N-acetyltransferase [Virgisporangium aliadipatigenens]GIJ47514.1 hypothetical protein Val02_44000 [Virgisporangium aliadipatigenens]
MSVSQAAVESKDVLVTTWADLIRDRGGDLNTDQGVSFMWADSTFGFWNTIAFTDVDTPQDALGDRLSRAASYMRTRSQAGYLWVFEELLSAQAKQDLFSRAAEAGLQLAFSGCGMAGDLSVPDPHHPELEFRRVESDEELVTYGEINGRAYGMTLEAGRNAIAGSKLWLHDAYAYVGYRDGRPVTCAATIAARGSVFLALVATVPEETRRGYGEAVTRKAIHEGLKETGHRRVVLHATQAGRPVYERIGCRANTPIHFFQLADGGRS